MPLGPFFLRQEVGFQTHLFCPTATTSSAAKMRVLLDPRSNALGLFAVLHHAALLGEQRLECVVGFRVLPISEMTLA